MTPFKILNFFEVRKLINIQSSVTHFQGYGGVKKWLLGIELLGAQEAPSREDL